MHSLKGKHALITGGTSGIGIETARQFLREGARVAVTGITPATLETTRKEFGSDVLVIESDASDVAEQKRVAKVIQQAFSRLDVLFINAGIVDYRSFEEFDEAGFDHSFAINLKGPYFLIQALLPVFSNPASVVLNTSVSAHMGMPNNSIYAATKAGLISLARTLSRELISRGIRVNAISPGAISTPLYGKLGLPEEQLKAAAALIQGQIPAGRFGEASEVAYAVAFLASDQSSYTVGSELVIDGGFRNL